MVGNPPYVRENDTAKRRRYLDMYESAAGKYTLSAPFTERFLELATDAGFIGLINANAFTKRDFGQTLISKVLPRSHVTKVVDTSGAYLPGHGTPTLILFARRRSRPEGAQVISVLGKRGESTEPAEPSSAPVWSEIVSHHNEVGFEGTFISVEQMSDAEVARHPWVLVGGGARQLKRRLDDSAATSLAEASDDVGVSINVGHDEIFLRPSWWRGPKPLPRIPIVVGDEVRDWIIDARFDLLRPFSWPEMRVEAPDALVECLWPWRRLLQSRVLSGTTTVDEVGSRKWFDVQRLARAKHRWPLSIVFSQVATHNHFALDRGARLFKRAAPIVKLREGTSLAEHQALLGYLNSSTVGFWCRLVMFPKGGDQVGEGARLSKTPWQDRLDYAGNLVRQIPLPRLDVLKDKLLDLVVAAEDTVAKIVEQDPEKVLAATFSATPTLAALRDARTKSLAERARLRGILVSLQEEMDWRVYGLFGLPAVEGPSVDAVRMPVEPNHRPFEVRLAREVATDISASEWFRVHKREPPKEVGGPLAELYRKRLRLLDDPEHGTQLRLLETPGTKRRWSPPDDHKAFSDAVRSWLLERVEAWFREQPQPELRTARQLALELGRNPTVAAAHELLTEESGLDLVKLMSDLVDSEGVPFLAGYRYAETGMEKRASWEETWRLQRLEDEGKIAPELKRLGLRAIQVPDKYGPKDFLRHFWSLRGKLDVPKERFVTVPGGNTDEDSTAFVGLAGWNHIQVAQALSGLYQRRKTEDGWQKDRLVPLLAGIDERVPWLLQWHNEVDPTYGTKLGEFFRDFVAGEAHSLGVAVADLRKWTPPASPKRATIDPAEVLAALAAWKPEVEEDDDDDGEEAEPPEGPTDVELASAVGVTKALVAKALKKLIADGLVEKLSGRPARYLATGDEA